MVLPFGFYGAVEEIGDVEGFDLGTGLAEAHAYLQQATGVGGDDYLGASLENVLDLALLQTLRHGRFGQVVTSSTATAYVRLWQFHEITAHERADKFAGLLGDVLRVSEVAGVVVSRFERGVRNAECGILGGG